MSNTNAKGSAPQVVKATRRALGNQSSQNKAGNKKEDVLSFKIEKCQLVYYETLEIDQEECPICKFSLADPCNICQSKSIIDNCNIIQGECGHWFHYHCISQWLERASTCPICNSVWRPAANT